MKSTILALSLLAAAPAALVLPAPAEAQTQLFTVADCQALITQARQGASTVTITGKNADKDRAGLIAKLDAASSALAKGKTADAVQKLTDFQAKVGQLFAAGHMWPADAAALINQAEQAIDCINGLAG